MSAVAAPPYAEEELVLLERYLTDGDQIALDHLLELHRPVALRVARRFLDDPAAAEDAVQSAFCAIVLRTDLPRPHTSFRAWLLMAVANTCRTHLQSSSSRFVRERQALILPSSNAAPADEAPDAEERALVQQEVDALPAHLRLPLWLMFRDNLTAGEAASVLAIPERTVRDRVRQGLERLRLRLSGRGIGLATIPGLIALPGQQQAADATAATCAGPSAAATIGTCTLGAAAVGVILLGCTLLMPSSNATAPVSIATTPATTVTDRPAATPTSDAADLLKRQVQVTLRRASAGEALAALATALGGQLSWACDQALADAPRHGITIDDGPVTVLDLLDRIASASGGRWELLAGQLRLHQPGDEAQEIIAAAQRLDDAAVLERIGRLDRRSVGPSTLSACAAHDPLAVAALGRLLARPQPPLDALRLAGSWQADWAVPRLAELVSDPRPYPWFHSIGILPGSVLARGQGYGGADLPAATALGRITSARAPAALQAALAEAASDATSGPRRISLAAALFQTGDATAFQAALAYAQQTPAIEGNILAACDGRALGTGESSDHLRTIAADRVVQAMVQRHDVMPLVGPLVLARLGRPGLAQLAQRCRDGFLPENDSLIRVLDEADPHDLDVTIGDTWRDPGQVHWALPWAILAGRDAAISDGIRRLAQPDACSAALVETLARSRRPAATEALLAALPGSRGSLRRLLARHLAATRDPRVDAIAIELAQDADPEVRAAALSHLPP